MEKKYFINDNTDLRKYVPVTEAFTFSEIVPFFESVSKKYLRNNLGIGKELFDAILDDFNTVGYDALDEIDKDLVHHIRIVVSKLAMCHYVPFGVLNIGSDGISNIKSEDREAIKKWQKDELEAKFMDEGYYAIDALLDFLEENKEDYDDWTASEAYTLTKSEFINSVADFYSYYSLITSRRTFLALKPLIKQVSELEIKNLLGTTLYNAIKAEIVTGVITSSNQIHLNSIRPAVANLVMKKAFDQLAIRITDNGIQILSQGTNTDNSKMANAISEIKLARMKEEASNTAATYINIIRKSLESDFTDQSGSRKNDSDGKSYYV